MKQFQGNHHRRVMEIYQKSLSLLGIQSSSPSPHPPHPTSPAVSSLSPSPSPPSPDVPRRKGKFSQEEIDQLTSAISFSRYQNHQIDWSGVLLLMRHQRKLQSYVDEWKFLSQNKSSRKFLPNSDLSPSLPPDAAPPFPAGGLVRSSSSSSSFSSLSSSSSLPLTSSNRRRYTEEEIHQLAAAVKSNYHPDGTISWGSVAMEMRSQRSLNSLRCKWKEMERDREAEEGKEVGEGEGKVNERRKFKVLWSKSEEKKFKEVILRNGGGGGRGGVVDWKQVVEDMGGKRSLASYKSKWQKEGKAGGN
jgi:hypothetical protein